MKCSVVALLLLAGCSGQQWRDYSYLYCKVRDADPFIHQTVDSLVPVVGPITNVAVSAGCILIESHVPNTPPVVTPVTPSTPREELAP